MVTQRSRLKRILISEVIRRRFFLNWNENLSVLENFEVFFIYIEQVMENSLVYILRMDCLFER